MMTTPKSSSALELQVMLPEVKRLLDEGLSVKQMADKLGVRPSLVKDALGLLKVENDLEEGTLLSQGFTEAASAQAVLEFVDNRLMEYIKRYDELAFSSNEAVAKAALDQLMRFTTLRSQQDNREVVDIADNDLERFKKATLEVIAAAKEKHGN